MKLCSVVNCSNSEKILVDVSDSIEEITFSSNRIDLAASFTKQISVSAVQFDFDSFKSGTVGSVTEKLNAMKRWYNTTSGISEKNTPSTIDTRGVLGSKASEQPAA